MMVGRQVQLVVDKEPARPVAPVLVVEGLRVLDERHHPAVRGVDLEVAAGEIVAIAGVQGNGQTELVEALTGLRPIDAGHVSVYGRSLVGLSPRQLVDLGVAHIPEDRQRDGIVGPFPVRDNLVLNTFRRKPFARGLAMDRGRVRDNVAAQPTRGLDVGSIQYIHARIVEQRDHGTAVLIVSTELEEVLALGDRILVMFRGEIVGALTGADATREELGLLMAGATA
jgi:simple sugar transport system ATP-binding protein